MSMMLSPLGWSLWRDSPVCVFHQRMMLAYTKIEANANFRFVLLVLGACTSRTSLVHLVHDLQTVTFAVRYEVLCTVCQVI